MLQSFVSLGNSCLFFPPLTVLVIANCILYLLLHMKLLFSHFVSTFFGLNPLLSSSDVLFLCTCNLSNQLEWLRQCQDTILHWFSWQTPPVVSAWLSHMHCSCQQVFLFLWFISHFKHPVVAHTLGLALRRTRGHSLPVSSNLLVSGGSDVNCPS